MTRDNPPEAVDELALGFLQAYWRADLAQALDRCTSDALMELPASVPMKTPARVADLLPAIFNGVYPRFRGGRFDVRVESVISSEDKVAVEYVATGLLVNGRNFNCRYAMVLTIESGKVSFVRSYTDTRYVAAELLSEPQVPAAKDVRDIP